MLQKEEQKKRAALLKQQQEEEARRQERERSVAEENKKAAQRQQAEQRRLENSRIRQGSQPPKPANDLVSHSVQTGRVQQLTTFPIGIDITARECNSQN